MRTKAGHISIFTLLSEQFSAIFLLSDLERPVQNIGRILLHHASLRQKDDDHSHWRSRYMRILMIRFHLKDTCNLQG